MIDLIIEGLRTVLFPSIVAIATLYAGSKFNDKKGERYEKREAEKQKSVFYLNLHELIEILERFEEKRGLIDSLKHEHRLIKIGDIDYNPSDYDGTPKVDYLNNLVDLKDGIESIDLPKISDQLKQIYGALTSSPIDKLSAKDSFGCLAIMRMGSNPNYLLEKKEALIEAKAYYKPSFI